MRAELDAISALPTTRLSYARFATSTDNLAGPAGYVSMEDGCSRRVRAARHHCRRRREGAIVEMGGSGTAGEGTRATEAAVRGFWKCYRDHLGI